MPGNKVLSFGLQTGYINYKYDLNKINQEQADQALLNTNNNVSKPNFGTGVYYKTDSYFLGISIPRILNADVEDGDVLDTG